MSPSIYYVANPVYSKEIIINGDETWLPIVQVKVKKGCYTRHDHTLGSSYIPQTNEPTVLEFRVKGHESEQNLILRSENT